MKTCRIVDGHGFSAAAIAAKSCQNFVGAVPSLPRRASASVQRGARSRTARQRHPPSTSTPPHPTPPVNKARTSNLSLLPGARRQRLSPPLAQRQRIRLRRQLIIASQPASIRFSLLNPPVAVSNPGDHRVARHYFSRSQPIDSTSPSPFLPHPPVDSSTCSFPPDGGGNRPTHPRPPPSPRQFSLESSSFGVPVASDLLLAADGAACASPGRPHSPCLLAHAAGGP